VRDTFPAELANAPNVFTPSRPGHWYLDLPAAVTFQLQTAGVPKGNFTLCPYHTDTHPEIFYSHRAAPGCPRMAAFMGLER
jgi:copper oxidase (laccase) domain-containing protein